MQLVERAMTWLVQLWQEATAPFRRSTHRYASVEYAQVPPQLDGVRKGVVHVVQTNGQDRWAMFGCPCGCGQVITLSLQAVHHPHWRLRTADGARPSLHPSVWRQVGCHSHFWIADGRVRWC